MTVTVETVDAVETGGSAARVEAAGTAGAVQVLHTRWSSQDPADLSTVDDPATGRPLVDIQGAGAEQVDQAVRTASGVAPGRARGSGTARSRASCAACACSASSAHRCGCSAQVPRSHSRLSWPSGCSGAPSGASRSTASGWPRPARRVASTNRC